MRTSRKGEDPTKKKGVEPTKAQSEVKVTAKRPGEPQPKKYTWDDVSKLEATKASNKAKREKYESDVETYNKQMKAYSNQPKNRDMSTFFQGGGRYLSGAELEKFNKEQEESGAASEQAGLKASKVYVSKGYGMEDAEKGGLSSGRGAYQGYKGAYHTWLEKPSKVASPIYEKEESIDVNRIDLPKMELRKPKLEPKNKKLATYTKPEKEEPTFEEPTGGIKYRTKYKTMRTQGRGNETLLGKAKNVGRFVKSKVEAIGKDNALSSGLVKTQGKARLFQGKTGKQAKEFKAYYGAPSSISGSDRSSMTASDIAQERESLKGVKKELRADIKKGGVVPKSELRAELRNVRKDIRATKQAEKYASKNIEARSIYPGGKEEVVLIEKPNAGSNVYRGSELGKQYSEFTKSQQIKKSSDNPANRNTTFGRKIKNS